MRFSRWVVLAGSLVTVVVMRANFVFSQNPASAPAGTPIRARLETEVTTSTSEIGDRLSAIVTKNIQIAGIVVVPKGSHLDGKVETVQAGTQQAEGHVRLVFREIELPDGRRQATWITKSFAASASRRNLRYAVFMSLGSVAGGLIGGRRARTAGILGGVLAGFVLAGSRTNIVHDLRLKSGQEIPLELGEDLVIPKNK